MALFMRKASCITRLFASARARCCAAGSSIVVLWRTKKHLTPAIPPPHHHLDVLRVDQTTRTTLQWATLPSSTASTSLWDTHNRVPNPHLEAYVSPGKKRPRNSLQVSRQLQQGARQPKHQSQKQRESLSEAAFTPITILGRVILSVQSGILWVNLSNTQPTVARDTN